MALTTRNRFSRFIAALYESAVPSRDCHVGRWPPRNDKPLVFAILTAVCTDCKCVAGSGMPLPYKGRCGRRGATKPTTCKALTTRKGHAASERRQSRQRLRSERRYKRNRRVPF